MIDGSAIPRYQRDFPREISAPRQLFLCDERRHTPASFRERPHRLGRGGRRASSLAADGGLFAVGRPACRRRSAAGRRAFRRSNGNRCWTIRRTSRPGCTGRRCCSRCNIAASSAGNDGDFNKWNPTAARKPRLLTTRWRGCWPTRNGNSSAGPSRTCDPKDRELLLLKYTENWTCRELAERLGIRVTAVESRLDRARQRLRSWRTDVTIVAGILVPRGMTDERIQATIAAA